MSTHLIAEGIQKPSQERIAWSWAVHLPLHLGHNAVQVIQKVMEDNEKTGWDEIAIPAEGKYQCTFTYSVVHYCQKRQYFCMPFVSGYSYYYNYHTSNSRECVGVNGEALQLHQVYIKPYFLLQVKWKSVSGTTSHVRSSEHAMKLKVHMIKSLSP